MSIPNRAPVPKCQRCRDDRQACLPRDRAWLERDCDRCIHYQYKCGPSLQPSKKPTSDAVHDEDYMRRMGLVYRVDLALDGTSTVYACMASLETIAWDYAGLFDAAASGESFLEGPPLVGPSAVAMGAFVGEMYASNRVLFQHWQRSNYIHAYDEYDVLYRAYLINTNASEAKRLATEKYIQDVCASQINKDSQISSREDIEAAVQHILHRGGRWRSLVAAVGSAEVLLMDDRLYIGVKKSIGDIIKDGTSEEFGKLKNDLLLPEGQVRNICLALSGVTEMLFELSDSPKDSRICQYLTSAITRRFDNVFGQPGPDSRMDPNRKVVISIDYLLRSIMDIFGFSFKFTTSHKGPDMYNSMEVEEPQGSFNSGPTPPGTYAGLSPSNDFLYDWLE